jgi:GT2 family glycosyltransferase
MKICIVTVNFKTAPMTADSVDHSLRDLKGVPGHVVVVDNGSGDGSLRALRDFARARGWGDRVTILDAGRNGGFGAGNNHAMRWAMTSDDPPDYFYLVNPDAFVEPGSIPALVAFMDARPRVGIAGTRIRDGQGEIHASAFRFPSAWSELERGLRLGLASRVLRPFSVWQDAPTETSPVDWVSGASCVFRRTMLEDIGLFDEKFFLYFEETDLCRRAAEAGWERFFVADAEVRHLEGVSTGIRERRRIPGFWLDSRRRYFLKAGGRKGLWLADAAWAGGFSTWRLRRRVLRRPDEDPPHALRDFLRHTLGLPPAT